MKYALNDKELADKVVALGVGYASTFAALPIRYRFEPFGENMYASEFVHDWRVAGALMEMMDEGMGTIFIDRYTSTWQISPTWVDVQVENESLPRAIIEACVAALSEDGK